MIRNRNLVFGSANDSSHSDDKYVQLPKISSGSIPSAVADGSSGENEGGLVYDTTNNEVKISDGNSWAVPGRVEVTYGPQLSADIGSEAFFIANAAYEVIDVTEVHSTAESTAGSLNIQLERLQSTEAPGGNGDALLTDNSNAGFDGKGTANTVQTGTLVSDGTQQLSEGDRLGLNFSASANELDGVVVAVTLKRL